MGAQGRMGEEPAGVTPGSPDSSSTTSIVHSVDDGGVTGDTAGVQPIDSVDHGAEARLAFANAIKLSLSLVGTIAVAVIVRIFVPRYLGPSGFGQLSFAEAFAATFFTFATFGVDTYIRKEVATRIEHANDFYAGFFVVRLLASVAIFGMMAAGLHWLGKGPLEWRLAFIFALGQVAFIDNYTLSAFLQAASKVNELAWMNVASKIIWCGSIFAGLLLGAPVEWVAVCFFISETIKTVYLMVVAHRRLHLTWKVNMAATWAVIIASLPYFVNNIALRIYEKLNVIMLSKLSNDTEVGWYSAAMTIAGFSLLFLPVLQAVLMPMAARMALKSEEAMNEVMRGGARLTVVGGTLIALILALNAQTVAHYAFGNDYNNAALSLQVLAPMFPLTYLATVGSLHLIQQNRTWTLIRISLLAVLLNPILNGPLIAWGYRLGPGKAGAMSALATVCTELITVSINLWLLGRAAVDKRFWFVTLRTLLICGVITLLHYVGQALGIWRIPIEIVVYGLLAVGLKTLPLDELRRLILEARRSRTPKHEA